MPNRILATAPLIESQRLSDKGRPESQITILPAVTESEWLVPLCRRAMKQADIVHRITTAGLMIDAAIVPHHEIAQAPFMTIHVPWRCLVSK